MEDSTAASVLLLVLAILCFLAYKGYQMAKDPNNLCYKDSWQIVDRRDINNKPKKYFGFKFWLIMFFFFPISLVYAAIKIMKYQNEQNIRMMKQQNNSNKYQELYYKELYEEQKRKNEKELKKELQEENNE